MSMEKKKKVKELSETLGKETFDLYNTSETKVIKRVLA